MLLQERISDPKVGSYGSRIGLLESNSKKKKLIAKSFCKYRGKVPITNQTSKHCLNNKKLTSMTNVTP